jgi:hypothetical protein
LSQEKQLHSKMVRDFDHYFGPASFNLKQYSPEKERRKSDKIKKTLFQLAKDPIN